MQAELRSRIPRAAAGVSSALVLVAVACSTPTTETNVWQSPTYAAGPMKRIAVFGGRLNESERRTVEDGFVSALATYGVRAAPSYTLFPQGQVPTDVASVRATLQRAGYDGALVSTLKGVSEQVLVAPAADWGGGFYGAYWGPGAPAYAETDQFVKFETTLWSTSSGKMVWSTITQTENPTSGRDFTSSLTKTVVPSLANAGLIPSNQGKPVSLAQ
jgi:hypothetical protein